MSGVLDYFGARSELEKGKVAPLYLIYGENSYLASELERSILHLLSHIGSDKEAFSSPNMTLGAALEAATSISLFKNPRLLTSEIGSYREIESFASEIKRYAAAPPESTCLVIRCLIKEAPTAKVKAYLGDACRLVRCPRLIGSNLQRWIREEMSKRQFKADYSLMRTLVEAQGDNPDLNWLSGEIEKMYLVSRAQDRGEGGDPSSSVSSSPRTSVFTVTDAIGQKDTAGAISALHEALRWGEPPSRLCFMLARHLMLLLRAKIILYENEKTKKRGQDYSAKAKRLGISPYEEKKVFQQARGFKREEVVALLNLLLDAEGAMKSGLMPGDMALEVFIGRASQVLGSG